MALTPHDACARSGDQGFLNAYFAALPGAPLFEPESAPEGGAPDAAEHSAARALWRLPTAYNADVGLYVLNRRAHAWRKLALRARASCACADACALRCAARAHSNTWPLPRSSLRVLHFTLGPLKPWQWWAPWLVPAAAEWQAVRRRTPGARLLGAGGASWRDAAAAALLLAAPCLALGASRQRAARLLERMRALNCC